MVRRSYDGNEIYEYICRYATEHGGNSPSIRRITMDLDISSTSVTWHWIKKLVSQGKLQWVDGEMVITGANFNLG